MPAVGPGGMFELWCERVGAASLDAVRRFDEGWQAKASLALRRGERAGAAAYAAHGRLVTVHPALVAERLARIHQAQAAKDKTVAITTASAGMAREINVAIQRKANPRRAGRSVVLADGTAVFAGDRVAPGATPYPHRRGPRRAQPPDLGRGGGRRRRLGAPGRLDPGQSAATRGVRGPPTWSSAGR